MKTRFKSIFLSGLLLTGTFSAFAQSSGHISYEVVRKTDPSGMRIMINGEQVKPGDPNFPADVPDTRTFGQKVTFSGNFAKESRDEQNAVVRTFVQGGGGPPRTTNMGRPFEEQTFLDFVNLKTITQLTVGKAKEAKTYQAETPVKRTTGWQSSEQTRKIAGYNCKKATVPFKNETYTVWFTTELPLTYSPIPDLMPEKGVVLLIEGSGEQFKASKVSLHVVDDREVTPTEGAERVAPDKLADLRQKAVADFQQQLMTRERN
ncbi:GLPGLI family protein [Dyadobacter sp. LJ53]|uniref:GLPGLI family protein n=1 Tax=Dyadobacter chenwenxiniae TaxID=2906456 RepID=UPI001F168DB9|nr:GLPGLI family protein [Dyadobacter chenwenxiniae]MCF0051741.1 GLPGLI family protein [Dyadobacter chenwenxiniae]